MSRRASKHVPFERAEVAEVFDAQPARVRNRLLRLRTMIFEIAATTEGVGELEEALKWGEPAYLTTATKSGTTIRIASKSPTHYALYVHCQTDLIDRFRSMYPELECIGNREVAFDVAQELPEAAVRHFIAEALTYRRARRG